MEGTSTVMSLVEKGILTLDLGITVYWNSNRIFIFIDFLLRLPSSAYSVSGDDCNTSLEQIPFPYTNDYFLELFLGKSSFPTTKCLSTCLLFLFPFGIDAG